MYSRSDVIEEVGENEMSNHSRSYDKSNTYKERISSFNSIWDSYAHGNRDYAPQKQETF